MLSIYLRRKSWSWSWSLILMTFSLLMSITLSLIFLMFVVLLWREANSTVWFLFSFIWVVGAMDYNMLWYVSMHREKSTYLCLLFGVFVGPFCVQMCVRVSKIVNVIQFLFKVNALTLAYLSFFFAIASYIYWKIFQYFFLKKIMKMLQSLSGQFYICIHMLIHHREK